MSTLRKVLLAAVVVVLLVVSILTWGSVGSAVLAFCLLLIGPTFLWQKYVNSREAGGSDYTE